MNDTYICTSKNENNTLYLCQYMYKYAIQDLHRKQVHVSSVPRHCVPSEVSTAIGDGTETQSTGKLDLKS